MLADQLRDLQSYRQQRTAKLGIEPGDVSTRVQEFLKENRSQRAMSPVEPVPTAVVDDVNVLVTAVASAQPLPLLALSAAHLRQPVRRLRGNYRRCC